MGKQVSNVVPFQRVVAFAIGMVFIVLLNLVYRTFILDSAKVIKEIIRSNHSALTESANTLETSPDTISKVLSFENGFNLLSARFLGSIRRLLLGLPDP